MRIYSPMTEYTVLRRIDGGRRLVARDGRGGMRLLVVVNDTEQAKLLLPLLLGWKELEHFTDFIEFFPSGDGLIAVFAYYQDGQSMERMLEGADYQYRAALLRSLFGLLLSQDLPAEIVSEVLLPENLMVSASGKVRPLYDLPHGGTATPDGAARRIIGGADTDFAERLADVEFHSYADMYAAADETAAVLAGYIPPPAPEGLTLEKLRTRAEDIAQTLLAHWAVILGATALIAGYAAVGLLFYNTVINPPSVDNGIRGIGTVVVSDGL